MLAWRHKTLIAAILFFIIIYALFLKNYGYASLVFILNLLVILLIFKNEWVILSLYQMRQQNLEKSSYYLEKIKNIDRATPLKKDRAYYYYLSGMVYTGQKQLQKAEISIKKSLDLGLKGDADLAMAKMQLAAIYANKRQLQMAQAYLQQAKKHDTKKLLSEQIAFFEKQLKHPQQNVMFAKK